MFKSHRVLALIPSVLTLAASAQTDLVSISGGLSFASGFDTTDGEVFYRLTGQSAYYSLRTSSLTTGGQLDGITSYDAATSVFQINFQEVFPEAGLTDYLRFGYLGVIQAVQTLSDGSEVILDTSFVIAGQPGFAEGTRVQDILPLADEATLVNALTGSFDSPEFFAALDAALNSPALLGEIALSSVDFSVSNVAQFVRAGQPLELYAFIGGANGDEASSVGFLETSITRIIPTPGVATIGVLGMLAMADRRRRA